MSTTTKAGPSSRTGQPILTVRGVTKSFPGVRALKGVDLTVWPGEVHALVGENGAGKSTLMKILAGAQRPDGGEISLDGKPVHFHTPHQARAAGIGIIYQELTIAPNLTVAGNVFLGSEETTARLPYGHRRDGAAKRRKVLDRLGARFKAAQRAAHLSIAEQQQVEIARALFYKSRILVMDEPTTALSDRETDRLFEVVRQLRSEGMAIIYISHRMAEIYAMADRLSVFRDGEYVGELTRPEFSSERIIEMMVGRKLEDLYPEKTHAAGDVVLRVRNMSDKELVKNASFEIRAGEVLGLSGLVGAGRTELARLIFGADEKVSGEVYLNGKLVDIKHPIDAVEQGIGYVPEDRKLAGVFLQMSCRDNIAMNIFQRSAKAGVIDFKDVNERSKAQAKSSSSARGFAMGSGRRAFRGQPAKAASCPMAGDQSEGAHPRRAYPRRGYRSEGGNLLGDSTTRQQGHGRAISSRANCPKSSASASASSSCAKASLQVRWAAIQESKSLSKIS